MAFYKVRLQKKSQLYYPQAITVGKQISTAQVADNETSSLNLKPDLLA
jgi:hypothetical protein